MEGLQLVFLLALACQAVDLTQGIFCHSVTEECRKQTSFPICYSREIRRCFKGRKNIPGFQQTRVNSSSEGLMNTTYGHKVHIPTEALRRSRVDISDEKVTMTTSVLNSSYFTSKGDILEQQVLGVWVGEQEVSNLSQPITITFRSTNSTNRGQCVFWDENKGNWSQCGCETLFSEEEFNCSCNHLSFFAILLQADGASISQEDQQRLTLIQYCGSALTILLTTLTCLMHLTHRKRKADHSSSIHLQLSLALMLLHVSFLLSAWGAWHTQGQPITALCQGLGAGLHWALLATFSWMAIEGFHLYLLLVRVFNIYVRRYLLKLGLLGWGLPSVTVIICAALGMYGPYSLTDSLTSSNDGSRKCGGDNKGSGISLNQSQSPLCWLSDSGAGGWRSVLIVKYSTVHAYLGLILLFNSVILVLIGYKLLRAGRGPVQGRGSVCRDAITVFGLSCALGLPWILAFCSHGPLTLTGTYLFTILNGLQGVFLFLWALSVTCRRLQQTEFSSNSQSTVKMSSLGGT